ncbi:MAG TPA: SRPBCC family protein [Aquihabitans sp.]|nr:SRPBCC family protein [Aquihabitans sp.]
MNTDSSIEIEAPASVVWDVFADVERWHEWTASIERITPLDEPGIQVGRRFEIKQPRFPKLVWEVTAVEPGRSWTWRQSSPGGTTFATHWVRPLDGDRTLVEQRIDQRGPIGVAVGVITRTLTRRYLQMEGEGLRARSEERARRHGSAA